MLNKFEPILNAATLSTIVSAVLAVAVAFNVPITEDQRNALLGLVAAVGAIFWAGSLAARRVVTPIEKVEENIIPLVPVAGHLQAVASESLHSGEPPVLVATYS